MRQAIEARIKRQEQRIAKKEEPAPEEYGRGMRAFCETGEFPEGTHPKVQEYAIKAHAFAQALREGVGLNSDRTCPENSLTNIDS